MKLFCKAVNVDERVIEFGDLSKPDTVRRYAFARNERGDLVCDVTDREHLAKLLAIPDGYEIYDPDAPRAAPVVDAAPSLSEPAEQSGEPESEEEVDEVPEDGGASGNPHDIPDDPIPVPAVAPTPVEVAAVEPQPEKPSGAHYNGLTRKQLEKAYTEKFNKKPHPRATDETLLEKLTNG